MHERVCVCVAHKIFGTLAIEFNRIFAIKMRPDVEQISNIQPLNFNLIFLVALFSVLI